eukprot:g6092.t1
MNGYFCVNTLCCPVQYDPNDLPMVPEEVQLSPWKPEEGILREYHFLIAEQYKREIEIHNVRSKITPEFLLGRLFLSLINVTVCLPCVCADYYQNDEKSWERLKREKLADKVQVYMRPRVALTKQGILYKEISTVPFTPPQTNNPCSNPPLKAYGRFEYNREAGKSKIIPYDTVVDIILKDPAGSTFIREGGGCCPCGSQLVEFPNFVNTVNVSTVGLGGLVNVSTVGVGGLRLNGLIYAENFRESVLALKQGRSMPPAPENRSINDPDYPVANMKQVKLGVGSGPADIEMNR